MKVMQWNKFVSLFLVAVFALAVAALPASAAASSSSERKGQTIVEIAVSNPDFSTLVSALVKADLVDALNGPRKYTVFAPTNAAFDALAVQLGFTDGPALVEALPAEQLTPILLYHVTNGVRPANSLFPPKAVRMLTGDLAYTSVAGDVKFIDGQPILATNIKASNGLIHVIGGVMLP